MRRLIDQRGASARTVESYRDAFELLFGYVEKRLGKPPVAADPGRSRRPADPGLPRSPRDRPAQQRPHPQRPPRRDPLLHAIRRRPRPGLPADHHPGAGHTGQTVRPASARLPHKEQIAAILAAPDRSTWSGRRDAVLLAVAYNTGARVSELTGLRVRDVLLDRQSALHLHGKGRKQRVIPLWASTATELRVLA